MQTCWGASPKKGKLRWVLSGRLQLSMLAPRHRQSCAALLQRMKTCDCSKALACNCVALLQGVDACGFSEPLDCSCVALLQGMDAYDFSEPVDVLKQLGKEFWSGLASKKWTERRDALQSLRALAKTPKIAPGDFGEVSR